jgi:hypothetical protein
VRMRIWAGKSCQTNFFLRTIESYSEMKVSIQTYNLSLNREITKN